MSQLNPTLSAPRINYNSPASMNVSRLNTLEKNLAKSMQRISSGVKITRPADDVTHHAISEKTRGQIRSMNAAARNIQDGITLVNIADGALNEITNALQRIRELATQSANGTMTDDDRVNITAEVNKLREEIDYVARTTMYNGKPLLNGESEWGEKGGGNLQINSNNHYNTDYVRYTIPLINTETLGIDEENMSVGTQEEAGLAIDIAMEAVNSVTAVRADLGAIANRLEHAWKHVDQVTTDNQTFESTIRDTDIAEEMVNFTRDQILNQYCSAMLAQANQTPESILQLLRG